MKKVIFAVLIVALAMLATTCDSAFLPTNLSSGSGQGTGVTAAPEWATISVNVGSSDGRARAMSKTLNEDSVDLYEVVFVYNNGEITVRDTLEKESGAFPIPWYITVPAVDYTTGNNTAVLFAGESGTPNILIAIGDITGGGNFTEISTSVTFTLSEIISGVDQAIASSSFKFDVSTDAIDDGGGTDFPIDGTYNVPVVKIPAGATGKAASYTFANTKYGSNRVLLQASPTITLRAPTGGDGDTDPELLTVSSIGPASGYLTNGKVTFTIAASSTAGLTKLYINIPVYAISSTTTTNRGPAATVWSIQGGLNNSAIDNADTGGAILFEVIPSTPPTEPSVEVNRSGAGESPNYDGTTNPKTWTVSMDQGVEDVVLKATDSDFTGTVTLTWKYNTTGTVGTDADATNLDEASVSTSEVGATTGDTLTILRISTYITEATDPFTFYLYCIASDGIVSKSSNLIQIDVMEGPVSGTAGITDLPTLP